MPDLKEVMKKVVNTFKRPIPPMTEGAKNIKAVSDAAKATSKAIQNEKA